MLVSLINKSIVGSSFSGSPSLLVRPKPVQVFSSNVTSDCGCAMTAHCWAVVADLKLTVVLCAGPIRQVRLKSDTQHSTRIAFVEFEDAADAQKALRECSGALLGAAPYP